jgi:hypothetical protein
MSAGFYRQGRPNRRRRLTNLQIAEVSSVDRGAGEGCEVKLLKRRSETMTTVSVQQVQDANFELLRKENSAPTLSPTHYEDMMKRVAVSSAIEVFRAKAPFAKRQRDPVSQNDDDVTTRNLQPSLIEHGNGLDWSKVDWSDTAQASAAHKAEQAYKNAQGSHAGENSRGMRDEWNNALQQPTHNPKPVSP